jgi:hypothetical protein
MADEPEGMGEHAEQSSCQLGPARPAQAGAACQPQPDSKPRSSLHFT